MPHSDDYSYNRGIGLTCTVLIAEAVALTIYAFSPSLISLFDRTPEVVAFGVMHQRVTTPFFFLLAYSHGMAAVFRGAGKSTIPLTVMLVCWCLIRVSYVTIVSTYSSFLFIYDCNI